MSNSPDIKVQDFKKDIFPKMKSYPHPITDQMDKDNTQMVRHWSGSQEDHLEEWLESYPTSDSMRYLYNHLQCPNLLVYIAETLGFDKRKLDSLARESLLRSSEPSRCKFIREQIPWETIYHLAVKLKTSGTKTL